MQTLKKKEPKIYINRVEQINRVVFCFFLVIVFSLVLSSCAMPERPIHTDPKLQFVENQIATLHKAIDFRHTGLSIAGDLYKAGMLDEKTKEAITKAGDSLKLAITISLTMLQQYAITGEKDTKLESQLILYQQLYLEFSRLILPYIMQTGE